MHCRTDWQRGAPPAFVFTTYYRSGPNLRTDVERRGEATWTDVSHCLAMLLPCCPLIPCSSAMTSSLGIRMRPTVNASLRMQEHTEAVDKHSLAQRVKSMQSAGLRVPVPLIRFDELHPKPTR